MYILGKLLIKLIQLGAPPREATLWENRSYPKGKQQGSEKEGERERNKDKKWKNRKRERKKKFYWKGINLTGKKLGCALNP